MVDLLSTQSCILMEFSKVTPILAIHGSFLVNQIEFRLLKLLSWNLRGVNFLVGLATCMDGVMIINLLDESEVIRASV